MLALRNGTATLVVLAPGDHVAVGVPTGTSQLGASLVGEAPSFLLRQAAVAIDGLQRTAR